MKRRHVVAALPLLGQLPAFAQAEVPAGLTVLEPGRLDAQPLFAARLIDLDDKPAQAKAAAGRVLVVNFWARWCGPCKVEIPELIALRKRASAVDVLGIAIESDPAAVRDFARAYEMDYALLLARDGGLDLMRALGNTRAGLPFTLVLDRRGMPAALRLGLATRAQLDAAVQLALRRG
ncbi:MAG: TlpA disulfide reductase family protein [Burkholderiaceae bacterium]